MRRILQRRFQVQLALALVAAASVAVLTVGLVANAVSHADGYVMSDADRTLDRAIRELRREYELRVSADSQWAQTPPAAQDVTLRGISQTVLNAYPGVEGGYWAAGRFLGYSYPTHDAGSAKLDVPEAERPQIEAAIADGMASSSARRSLRGRRDLVAIAAVRMGPAAVWAMKRLPGQAEPGQRTRNLLAAALVMLALLGAAGVLATAIGLNRGVAQMKSRLAALHAAGTVCMPERYDELGEIGAAVNEMARTRRRLEDELRREDRARVIGRLVGTIAHEMRNPLNGIRLSLQMLARRHQDGRLAAADFQVAIDEVDRMNRLLGDLLSFQQPRPAKLETRRVGEIANDCARAVQAQAEGAGVRMTTPAELGPSAWVDEQYIRQILMNLLLNAIESSAAVTVSTAEADGKVALRVSDEGPGLTAEQQEHLFEPFYTTKPNGHGLGLAVSRELARSMGGELRYQPGNGRGATFTLWLRGAIAG